MELIDKNKLLEGLKKLKQNLSASPIVVIEDVESLVESFEVKEVDLDKEMDFVKDAYYYFTSDERDGMMKVARHFFELGIKTQKG